MARASKSSKDTENRTKSKTADKDAANSERTAGQSAAGESERPAAGTPDAPEEAAAADPAGGPVESPVPTAPTPAEDDGPAPAGGPSALGLVLGGLVAGGIGFLAAVVASEQGWLGREIGADSALSETVSAQSAEIAALRERLDELAAREFPEPVDTTPFSEALAGLDARLGEVEDGLSSATARLEGLAARLDTIETRPAVIAPDASAALEQQLREFRAELDAVTAAARAEVEAAQARAAEIEQEAQKAAELAARQAALTELRAALESGAPFAGVLERLPDAPKALTAVAGEGVATLAELQQAFPDAARRALQSVQDVPENASWSDRATAFLRRHTNARSLSPREGDDPDAVLSRVEAALRAGKLGTAIAEAEALPAPAVSALEEWLDRARARHAAVTAAESLADPSN